MGEAYGVRRARKRERLVVGYDIQKINDCITPTDCLAVAVRALKRIAGGQCTGPDDRYICRFAEIKNNQWCNRCLAEEALTRIQLMEKTYDK